MHNLCNRWLKQGNRNCGYDGLRVFGLSHVPMLSEPEH